MSTAKIWRTSSISSEQTERLGELLGARLRGGEVIELISDLGGGKTTLTRGLVRGTGSQDKVGSPTFTLSREYEAPRFTVAHFDFYRLGEAGIVGDELAEVIAEPDYVVVVEWGDVVQDVLPERRLRVRIAQTGDATRDIRIDFPSELAYLCTDIDV